MSFNVRYGFITPVGKRCIYDNKLNNFNPKEFLPKSNMQSAHNKYEQTHFMSGRHA